MALVSGRVSLSETAGELHPASVLTTSLDAPGRGVYAIRFEDAQGGASPHVPRERPIQLLSDSVLWTSPKSVDFYPC